MHSRLLATPNVSAAIRALRPPCIYQMPSALNYLNCFSVRFGKATLFIYVYYPILNLSHLLYYIITLKIAQVRDCGICQKYLDRLHLAHM